MSGSGGTKKISERKQIKMKFALVDARVAELGRAVANARLESAAHIRVVMEEVERPWWRFWRRKITPERVLKAQQEIIDELKAQQEGRGNAGSSGKESSGREEVDESEGDRQEAVP